MSSKIITLDKNSPYKSIWSHSKYFENTSNSRWTSNNNSRVHENELTKITSCYSIENSQFKKEDKNQINYLGFFNGDEKKCAEVYLNNSKNLMAAEIHLKSIQQKEENWNLKKKR